MAAKEENLMFRKHFYRLVRWAVQNAQPLELNDLAFTLTQRYNTMYPDWEVSILSLPKEPRQKREVLDRVYQHIVKYSDEAQNWNPDS